MSIVEWRGMTGRRAGGEDPLVPVWRRAPMYGTSRSRASIAVAATLCLCASLAFAKDAKEAKDPARPPVIDPRADRLLAEMGKTLASAKQFSFHADIVYDDELPSAQKIQLAAAEDVAVRRPDRAYVEYEGDVGSKRLWYDGKHITLYDGAENVFASTPAPGKIGAAIQKLTDVHGFSPPLADFVQENPYAILKEHAQLGAYLGLHVVDGTRCHHLAFVDKTFDWQVWIEDGTQLVPRKIVITYKELPGSPQFAAVLSEWNLDEHLADATFEPFLPQDAKQIDFLMVKDSVTKK
jgi:hypothetical protein